MSNEEVKNLDINQTQNYEFINKLPVWDNHPRPVKGLTPFGVFDNDNEFQRDAPKVAKYIAYKLGYPLMDVELLDVNMYACFEDAVMKYNEIVNEFRIRENMLNIEGHPKNIDVTNRRIRDSLSTIVKLAQNYGEIAGAGSNIEIHKGYIELEPNKQKYDLKLWAEQNVGKPIEIKKIYYSSPPVLFRYYDPYSSTGIANYYLMSSFGWQNYSPGVTFTLMPVYEDLQRLQTIKQSNYVRRTQFGFILENNVLTIFPVPQFPTKLWFDFIILEDRETAIDVNDNGDGVNSGANVPLKNMMYKEINQWGRNWIKEYALACAMILLGEIRSKYSSIPIPDGEVSLNGSDLKSEGQSLKENLITQLRETMEQLMRVNQLDQKQRETESLNQILQQIPLKIYWY